MSRPDILKFRVLLDARTEHFAMDVARILRLSHYPAMARPVGRPAFLEGFVNFRGEPVPVLSLARLFGFDPRPPELYTPVIFFRAGQEVVGVVVEGLDEIVRSDRWREGEVGPDRVFNNAVRTVAYLADDTEACLLDPDRLMLEEEQCRLADLRAQAAERLEQLA